MVSVNFPRNLSTANTFNVLFLLIRRFPMLNKYIRSTIIVTVQLFLPLLLLFLLAPLFFEFSHQLKPTQHFLVSHRIGFLITHVIFYLAIIGLWPLIIYSSIKDRKHEPSTAQIKSALNAKWYLLTAMVIFEILIWCR